MPRTTTAPYAPGDRVRALMMTRDGATTLATVTIDTVRKLSADPSPRWRIGGARPGPAHPDPALDCPRVEWEVGADGRDIHGYVERDRSIHTLGHLAGDPAGDTTRCGATWEDWQRPGLRDTDAWNFPDPQYPKADPPLTIHCCRACIDHAAQTPKES